MTVAPNTRGSAALDIARVAAALTVFAGHLRSLFVEDYGSVAGPGVVATAFYAATAQGHAAVMVFFVLSGFLIASSVVRGLDRWAWRPYLIARGTRLQVVLLPALIATTAWDLVGLWTAGAAGVYHGTAPTTAVQGVVSDRLDVTTFAANTAFTQTILTAPYGSNGPLWSLANEFWYYILFPSALLAVAARGWRVRLANLALALLVAAFVGSSILALLPVWLMGAAVRWVPRVGRTGFVPWAGRLAWAVLSLTGHVLPVRGQPIDERLVG